MPTLQHQIDILKQQVDSLQKQIALVLQTREHFADAVVLPPLDSSVVWTKGQQKSQTGTHEIVSLIHEVAAVAESYPWPLYIQLTTAHAKGDGVGATVRLIQRGAGWATAFHAETFAEADDGVTIGVNIEPRKGTSVGRSIGLDVHSVSTQMNGTDKATVIDEAILVQSDAQSEWLTGIHFDQTAKGTRAIWLEGTWQVGLDVGNNKIRMNKDAELCFEATERFYVKYNSTTNRIEFHNRGNGQDRVIGYISAGAPEHEL